MNETTAAYLAAVVLSQFGLPYSARSSSINRMGCERVVIHMLFDSLKDTRKPKTWLNECVDTQSGLKSNRD